MKIRYGFVSNSSSASYIVTPTKTFDSEEAFLQDLYQTCEYAFRESEQIWVEREERWEEETRNRSTVETDGPFTNLLSTISFPRDKHKPVFQEETYDLPSEEKINIMRQACLNEGFDIIHKSEGKYSLSSFTSMHNSFMDMPKLLGAIYCEYLTYHGGADFSCEQDN